MSDPRLGRVESEPDERDWQLANFLTEDPLDAALAAVLSSWERKKTKVWAQLITARVKALSPPPPPPPPPPPDPTPTPDPAPTATAVTWTNTEPVLNQENTGHCVGFSCANWGNTDPINDHFKDQDGHSIYYECKLIEGHPGLENGTSVRMGAKALQKRGRLTAYAFAKTVDEIVAWLRGHGSVIVGTDWTDDMFRPDANGFVVPTGPIVGGHCYLAVGHLPEEDAILFLNSWGPEWGLAGYFKMKTADFATLLGQKGEACAAVELPL